ncbi:MAG: hypothetical protein EXR71_15980 [Myxococcales bacterium]|nr:hypothetical protein [Myxococcales bacterium]
MILHLAGCDTEELSQSWQIDRLRVLAVATEPAEPRPGELVTFSALIVSPVDPVAGSAWFVCSSGSADDFGCAVDPALFEDGSLEEADPEALAAAGFIGFLPALPPAWVVPADYLDTLAEPERLEGSFAMTYIAAIPEVPEGETLTEDQVELAYKRVPVSLATTPNHNPGVLIWHVDGLPINPGAEVLLDPGQAYDLRAELTPDSVESYTFVTNEGVAQLRTEEPYLSWYLEDGSFSQSNSLFPLDGTVYFSPGVPVAETASLWVVVRDRRGGMGWSELRLRFRAPA